MALPWAPSWDISLELWGVLGRAKNREISPCECSCGGFRGRSRGRMRGPTRVKFVFACSVRRPVSFCRYEVACRNLEENLRENVRTRAESQLCHPHQGSFFHMCYLPGSGVRIVGTKNMSKEQNKQLNFALAVFIIFVIGFPW